MSSIVQYSPVLSSIVQYSPGNIELLTSSDRVQSSGSPCCRACSIASASCISFNTILLVQPYFALALIQYHAWCSIEVLYIVYSVCARWFYGSVSGGSASLSSESSGGELLVSVSRGCVCVALLRLQHSTFSVSFTFAALPSTRFSFFHKGFLFSFIQDGLIWTILLNFSSQFLYLKSVMVNTNEYRLNRYWTAMHYTTSIISYYLISCIVTTCFSFNITLLHIEHQHHQHQHYYHHHQHVSWFLGMILFMVVVLLVILMLVLAIILVVVIMRTISTGTTTLSWKKHNYQHSKQVQQPRRHWQP